MSDLRFDEMHLEVLSKSIESLKKDMRHVRADWGDMDQFSPSASTDYVLSVTGEPATTENRDVWSVTGEHDMSLIRDIWPLACEPDSAPISIPILNPICLQVPGIVWNSSLCSPNLGTPIVVIICCILVSYGLSCI